MNNKRKCNDFFLKIILRSLVMGSYIVAFAIIYIPMSEDNVLNSSIHMANDKQLSAVPADQFDEDIIEHSSYEELSSMNASERHIEEAIPKEDEQNEDLINRPNYYGEDVLMRNMLPQHYVNMSSEEYELLHAINPVDLLVVAHRNYFDHSVDINTYRSSKDYSARLALFHMNPHAYEAIVTWEINSVGKHLETDEMIEFLETTEARELISYSENLDI